MNPVFWIGGFFGLLLGGTLGAMAMALMAAAGNDYGYVAISPDADEDPETTTLRQQLAETRQHLSACQAAAEAQQQRADYYYDLFCTGAKANADLRRTI